MVPGSNTKSNGCQYAAPSIATHTTRPSTGSSGQLRPAPVAQAGCAPWTAVVRPCPVRPAAHTTLQPNSTPNAPVRMSVASK